MAKVNDDQMLLGASVVGDIYSNMAQELFIRMIKRIKQRGVADLKDNPYLWQLEKLNDMHMLNEENIAYVSKETGVARELIDEIIQNEGLKVYQDTAEQIVEDTGATTPNYNSVQETLSNYAQQTFLDIDNLVNQTLLTTNLAKNPVMQVYQKIVEQSVAEVTTGLKSPDKAVSDTVMKWIDKGIPSGFIDKGGHTWSIERYADTVMTSTTYRVYNEMRTNAAEELGVDTFIMSSHEASRPACAPIQGHVVTKQRSGFESNEAGVGYVASLYDHDYGEPGGTMGINCRHTLTPFIIGVNKVPDTKIPNPKQAIANGKKQASQRSYERGIRDAKYKLEAAKQLGDDKLIQHYQSLLGKRRLGLRKLIDNNDFLHRDYSRERIYKNQKLIDNYKMNLLRKPAPKPVSKLKPVVNEFSSFDIGENTKDVSDFANSYNFKGLKDDVVDIVQKSLNKNFNNMNLPKLSGIEAITERSKMGKLVFPNGGAASYSHAGNKLYLNSTQIGTLKKLGTINKETDEAIETLKNNVDKLSGEKNKQVELALKSGRGNVDGSLDGIITHELGHQIHFKELISKNDELNSELIKIWKDYAGNISYYATSSYPEYIAESYTAYTKGEIDILDPKLVDYFNSLRKKKH